MRTRLFAIISQKNFNLLFTFCFLGVFNDVNNKQIVTI